ncbi:uncharacterized protein LOC135344386 [Halichondria panicea]|uniref:uncharacterized protein LOC135344386 n=1 Tax=Halichondria panicea TaxID=6063 RepID=UPI00312B3D6C
MQLVVKVVPSDIAWHWQNLNTADCLERLPSSSYGALKKSYHGRKGQSSSSFVETPTKEVSTNLPKTIMEKHVSFRTKKPVSVSGVIGSAAGQGALSKRSVTTPVSCTTCIPECLVVMFLLSLLIILVIRMCTTYFAILKVEKRNDAIEKGVLSDRHLDFISIQVDRRSKLFTWKEHGFQISIPDNSIVPYTTCALYIYSSTSGSYKFPYKNELVSPVFWINSSPSCTFLKCLTINLQHCANLKLNNKLTFVRADSDITNWFKEVPSLGHFSEKSLYGSLELSHFSGYAITFIDRSACEAVDRLYSASLFYLGRALGDWVVHLVITWDTEVHIRVCYHACMHCIHGLSMLPGFIV